MSRQRSLPLWLLRVVWVLQPLAFVTLLGDATESLDSSGRTVAVALLWVAWAAILLATLVPSTVSLTAGRLAAPLPLAAVLVVAIGPDVDAWKLAVAFAAAALAVLTWFSGDVGAALAQGSAYGAEERFPLKPPVPYLVPMVVFWLLTAIAAVLGVTWIANATWVPGVVAAAIAVALAVFTGPRFHQLARRWLVVVPAGVVIHDPMLLVENSLFRTNQLQAVHLAPAGTEAADLTGGTAGVAVEIVLREMDTIVKTGTAEQPTGVALHVLSVLVAPTRPGRALAAAAARHLPVG